MQKAYLRYIEKDSARDTFVADYVEHLRRKWQETYHEELNSILDIQAFVEGAFEKHFSDTAHSHCSFDSIRQMVEQFKKNKEQLRETQKNIQDRQQEIRNKVSEKTVETTLSEYLI